MKKRTDSWAIAAIVVAALIMGAPSLLYPFARDQAIFAYIGDVWLRGGLPYRDAWDVKPPFIFFIYSVAQFLFGHSMMAIRLLDLLSTGATGILLFILGKRLASGAAGMWAGILYPVLYYACWRFPDTAQSESFAAPFTVLMFLGAIHSREKGEAWSAVGAGICLGLMALLKTTFLIYALPAFLVAVWRKNLRWNLTPWAVVGMAIPFVITIGYFALQGATDTLLELLHAQQAYAAQRASPIQSAHLFGQFLLHWPLLIWAFAIGFLALYGGTKGRIAWMAGVVWVLMALLNAIVQHRFFTYHAVPLAAPLALLGGTGIAVVGQTIAQSKSEVWRVAIASVTIAMPLLLLLPAWDRYGLALDRWTGRMGEHEYLGRMMGPQEFIASEVVDTGRALAKATQPGDPILVIGFEPMIYFVAHRYSPTRQLSADPWLYETQIDPRIRVDWTGELLRDTSAHPPVGLVVLGPRYLSLIPGAKDVWPTVVTFRGRPYRKLTSIGPYRSYRLVEGTAPNGTTAVESAYPIMMQALALGLAKER